MDSDKVISDVISEVVHETHERAEFFQIGRFDEVDNASEFCIREVNALLILKISNLRHEYDRYLFILLDFYGVV
jgi:hypothetical protein